MNRRSTHLLLAAAALAAPALLTACGGDSTPVATDDVTPAAAPARTVTVEDLLTDADTVYGDGADWFRRGAGEDEMAGDLPNPCLAQGLTGTGATGVVRGDYELRNTDDPSVEVVGDFLTQLVAQYDDAEAAEAAYQQVLDAVAACEDRPAAIEDYRSFEPRAVEVDGATASVVDAHYGPLPDAFEDGDAAYIMETGVLRSGDRITVLTSVVVGQDYNFLDGTPVENMLVPAGALLAD